MKRTWLIAMLCLAVWLATAAKADLVSQDYLAAGDGLLTYDTQSGLRWLDVSATQGLSANQVLSGTGGWSSHFRYATYAELSALFEHAALPNIYGGKIAPSQDAALYLAASSFNALFNTTGTSAGSASSYTHGFYLISDRGIGHLHVVANFNPESAYKYSSYSYIQPPPTPGGAGPKSGEYDWYSTVTGSMLVLAVPEPSSYALLLGGLFLFGVIARRRAG